MIVKLIAYKDIKLNVFTNPMTIGNVDNSEIIENVRRMCADPKMPSVYFEYDLYLLGTFDDKNGHFETKEPEFLVSLADYRHLASKEEKVDKVDVVG